MMRFAFGATSDSDDSNKCMLSSDDIKNLI